VNKFVLVSSTFITVTEGTISYTTAAAPGAPVLFLVTLNTLGEGLSNPYFVAEMVNSIEFVLLKPLLK
jgi:hypothetical protein